MKRFLWLLLLLCPYVSMARQAPVMKVGSIVPDVLLNDVQNYKTCTARLYDFKSKLLLIDLWATTCSGCVAELKMLDSMQHCYPGKLKVVAVNSLHDTRERLGKLMNRIKLKVSIPMVLGNQEIQQMFPHTFVPHFAWVDSNFKVLAITGGEPVNALRIREYMEGVNTSFTEDDMVPLFDANLPLFANDNGGSGKQLIARSTFTSALPGVPSGNFATTDSAGKIIHWILTNQSAEELLTRAHSYVVETPLFKWEGIKLTGKFTYELITPPVSKQEALRLMREDLVRYLKVTAETGEGTSPTLFIHHLPN